MAEKFGIGKLSRHLFICLGPIAPSYLKARKRGTTSKSASSKLNLAGADGPCYRTKLPVFGICIKARLPGGIPRTWYTAEGEPENAERII